MSGAWFALLCFEIQEKVKFVMCGVNHSVGNEFQGESKLRWFTCCFQIREKVKSVMHTSVLLAWLT